jgi:hypothetical protein
MKVGLTVMRVTLTDGVKKEKDFTQADRESAGSDSVLLALYARKLFSPQGFIRDIVPPRL